MSIDLPPQLEESIRQKVESGQYASAGDVVARAMELLEDHEKLRQIRQQRLRELVGHGLDEAAQGRLADLEIEQVIEKARQQRRQGRESA